MPDEPAAEPRKRHRRKIAAQMQLRRSGALSYIVHAYDISETGCKAEFVERPTIGETVWLKFEGLELLPATVRWTSGFTVGMQFERPIDPRVLQQLLDRLT